MDPFARYLPALEATMQHTITPPDGAPALLYGMLHYHLGWVDATFHPVANAAGKRLRPVLLLLACEAQGGDWQQALPAAAAIELLHNFTLIHDDIEDHDNVRRGRPALWSVWGEPQAINAGDALFTLAYESLLNLESTGLPPALIMRAVNRYTTTILKITEGQCLDIAFERESAVTEPKYLTMVTKKTAVLIGLAAKLGGIIAGALEAHVDALREFGEALGIAFQMQDDLLGLWGNPEQTGKPIGSDLRNRKKTLPILHGVAHSPEFGILLAEETLDDAAVQQGLALLETTGSRGYTQTRMSTYHQAALKALAQSQGTGDAHAALRALAEQLLNREM
jgi:geranylgeranyl diphosphate synthase type I